MRRVSRTATTSDVDTVRSGIRDRSIRVVDVRRAEEYKQDHIPTSVNLPLRDLLEDDSPDRVADLAGSVGIDRETEVVIYDDTFGALASRVAWTLEYLGHRQVSLLETTYDSWRRMGLETDDSTPDRRPATYHPEINPGIMATAGDLEGRSNGTVLLDNRERLNYLEQHIPGAINIPYRTLASENGILRPPSEMRRIFANRGIDGSSPVITYCGSVGTLSGLAYYALRSIGIDNTRLYVRSFREWKSLNKPTEKQPDANYWDLSAE